MKRVLRPIKYAWLDVYYVFHAIVMCRLLRRHHHKMGVPSVTGRPFGCLYCGKDIEL